MVGKKTIVSFRLSPSTVAIVTVPLPLVLSKRKTTSEVGPFNKIFCFHCIIDINDGLGKMPTESSVHSRRALTKQEARSDHRAES